MDRIPTVSVWKDGKRATVNESDAPAWEANGWNREAPKAQEDGPAKPKGKK
jgi:hypothetical protein